MKIFLSSVFGGFEKYRDAASQAVQMLGHTAIRAETYSASPTPPQQACLQGVRDSDALLLIMGARYGYEAQSQISATHEEYREAKGRKPIFVFIEQGVEREANQQEFVREVQGYETGHYTVNFHTPQELQDTIVKAIHQYELSAASGPIDESEMLDRAKQMIPGPRGTALASLSLSVAGGPRQQILRPTEIEEPSLARKIMQQAMFGEPPLFDTSLGNRTSMQGNALLIEQDNASIYLDELGSVRITVPASAPDRNTMASLLLIQEDVQQKILQMLQFAGWLLDAVDPVRRLSDIVVIAGLSGASHLGWKTRAEVPAGNGPITYSMGQQQERILVHVSPPRRNRAALSFDSARIAEDLTALVRREKV